MGFIQLLAIFIFVAQSCIDQKMFAFIPEAEYFIGSQAITITGSDTNFLAPQDQKHSGGLLELTSQNNRFAVFKLPVKKSLPIHFKPGTKFLMQSHPIQRSR